MIIATDWLYDETGNPVFVNGSPVVINGLDEIRQALITNLLTRLGYFGYNEDIGMDMDWLYSGKFNQAEAETAVSDCLMQDQRVQGVERIDVTQNKNQIIFHIVVSTTLGTLDFTKEVNTNATIG